MATRRKNTVERSPSGRRSRAGEREYPPAQVRRLREMALLGLRDPEWGTELGRLFLTQKISANQYAAGKWWAETASWYQQAIGVRPMQSPSAEVGRGGSPPDPDSDEGRRQAVREAERAERYFAAHAVLLAAAPGAERAVRAVCEADEMIDGTEMRALQVGLLALAVHKGLTAGQKSFSGR